ncbi:unnamed protein product [Calicophoron daubneyi]|uniref:Uncharacterized protein n=1 Tax=Calicophoron daubneyi TaxID=300641 RepID=A0AAV2TND8_CALDB
MLFALGLDEHQKRSQEEGCLRESIREVKAADREVGMKLITEFQDYKQQALHRLDMTSDAQVSILEQIMADYREQIHELWEQLMANEMVVAEQIEEIVKEFERNIKDMVAYFIETAQNYLSKCREAAGNFHERLIEATLPYAERLAKADPQELETLLFPDRDTMSNCLSQSRDNQLLRIDQCEEWIIKRANNWCEKLIENLYQDEIVQRHLDRVTEINLFIDSQRTELDTYDLGAI